jgi:hypothetical protein
MSQRTLTPKPPTAAVPPSPAKASVSAPAPPASPAPASPAQSPTVPLRADARPPAAAPPAQPAAAAPKPDVRAPAPPPAEPAPAPPADPAPPAEKKRQQLTAVLGVNISQARCATHLKQNLGDPETEEQIRGLREALKDAKAKGEGQRADSLKDAIAHLSKRLVRMSNETPIAVAVVMDLLVTELIRHGMLQATARERKIVDVAHLHEGEPAFLLLHPLYDRLPVYAAYSPDHEEALRKERAAQNKAAKEAREAKKAAAEKRGAKAPAPKAARAGRPAPDDDADEEGHAEHTKTTFFTYVENALQAVRKDGAYHSMRVSNRVREYLSTLIAEGIARFARLAKILVQDVMEVRTMNADHVKAIVRLLMVDGGRTEAQVEGVAQQIDAKLELYKTHLDSEKEKKTAGADPGRRAELERARIEADFQRKRKQIEAATKRAADATRKAQDLTTEVSRLEPLLAAAPIQPVAAGGP